MVKQDNYQKMSLSSAKGKTDHLAFANENHGAAAWTEVLPLFW